MKYKISIIVPVFNVEDYIRDALESIVRQTIGLKHLEVIMVDDCSTDNSGEIIDEYAAKYDNFIAIHLPENSGAAGKPRNVGMERANSDYLMFLDPDDCFTDNACQILYEKITKEDVDIVLGTFTLTDEITKKRRLVHAFEIEDGKDEIIAKNIDDYKILLGSPPSLWAKIFKRNLIEQNKVRFPEGIPAQDTVFVIHALLKARGIIFINQVIVQYNNKREGSETHTWDKKKLSGRLQAYLLTYDICKENGREEYFISLFLKNKLVYWINKFIEADMNNSDKKEVLELSWPLFKLCQEHGLALPEHLKPVFECIVNKKYWETFLLTNQLVYINKREYKIRRRLFIAIKNREKQEDLLKKTLKQLKSSRESLLEMKEALKEISFQYDVLRAKYYESRYLNGKGRSLVQRLISWFPSIYILFRGKSGLKHNLININGYYSIKKNNSLDIGYYLKNNRDVRLSGQDPIIHYIYYGYNEGRKPNPTFNAEEYYKIHPDVRNSKINPLVHYSLYGKKEERKTS